MCGICGKISFTNDQVDHCLIEAMGRTLVHRGPDGEGVFTAGCVGLGQRRLSVIDLSTAATAPLSNEDQTVWVISNGEIYNYRELRTQLIARGHVFRTATDTEVLVHLYEEYGTRCVDHLRGMFAFAIWDSARQLIFGARDRLGKKPLYYAHTAKSLVFGSEIKAIMVDPSVSRQPNYQAIDQYLAFQFVPSPLTAFLGINKLPAAHFFTCDTAGDLRLTRYWSPPEAQPTTASRQEIVVELRDLLKQAVRTRRIADVPLGAFLSGGVDSASVVALLAQESSSPVKTFSIGFEEESHNELEFARLTSQRFGTDHHELVVRSDELQDVLPVLVRHLNEPFADSSIVPTYLLSRMSRQHVTVALSGDGADENFAGYAHYGNALRWERLNAIPLAVREAISRLGKSGIRRLPPGLSRQRALTAMQMLRMSLPDRYALQLSVFKPEEKAVLLTEEFQHSVAKLSRNEQSLAPRWVEGMDALSWMMRRDQGVHLPDLWLTKVDIASMANGLEVRSPYLDQELLAFTATIPSELKWSGGSGKRILKEALLGILPEAILQRPKMGFGVPISKWFRLELRDLMVGTLLDDRAAKRGIVSPSYVRRLVLDHVEGRQDWGYRLWTLLMLEMWFREFID